MLKRLTAVQRADIKKKLQQGQSVDGYKLDTVGRVRPIQNKRKRKNVLPDELKGSEPEDFVPLAFDEGLIEQYETKKEKKQKKGNTLKELKEKRKLLKAIEDNVYIKGDYKKSFYEKKVEATVYDVVPMIVDDNVELVARMAIKVWRDEISKENSTLNLQGFIRLIMASKEDKFLTLTITDDELNQGGSIVRNIMKKINQFVSNYPYPLWLKAINVFLVKFQNKGGCNHGNKDLHPTEKINTRFFYKQFRRVKLLNPMSSNNNCGIMCLLRFLEMNGNSTKPDALRTGVGLPLNTMLTPEQLSVIAFRLGIGLIVYNFNKNEFNPILSHYLDKEKVAHVVLMYEHYYLLDTMEEYCEKCNKYFMKKHTCDLSRQSFINSEIRSEEDRIKQVTIKKASVKTELNYDDVICYDLETFMENNKKHVPYACGWFNKEYKQTYGKGCMNTFIDELLKEKGKIITAYNTSRFDSYFLIDELVKKGAEITSIILNNGKIMSFEFTPFMTEESKKIVTNDYVDAFGFILRVRNRVYLGDRIKGRITTCDEFEEEQKEAIKEEFKDNKKDTSKHYTIVKYLADGKLLLVNEVKQFTEAYPDQLININDMYKHKKQHITSIYKPNKVFDLYLFVMDSLENACKAFQTEFQKSSFEHSKMKTWEDVETFRYEVEPYLKLDVLSLRDLFIKFNKLMYKVEQCNITKYVTLSNMAYELWSSPKYLDVLRQNDTYLEVFDSMDKFKFVQGATFGGRTYPMKRESRSKIYSDVVAGKINYEQLKTSLDFLFNADVSSLYPASMKLYKYPVGASRWSEDGEDEYKSGKMGFYYIEFKCPKDIRFAYLPRKTKNGGISWNLYDGSGVYSSVDIEGAVSCGYEVKFMGRCLVWDTCVEGLFSEYIDSWYKMKEEADRNKDKTTKAIAKLFLNGLYGKMLQRPILTTTKICNNIGDVYDFLLEYDIKDWELLEEKIILKGDTKQGQQAEKIRKPSYLGAFILSWSRRHMLKFVHAIDPSLKSCMFTYTDTDSLHITGEAYSTLLSQGLIKTKAESQLGFLCSDIDDEGLIISEKCIAPKTYIYEWINNKGEIFAGDRSKMKCKGIPKKCLRTELYTNDNLEEEKRELKYFSMKRIHTSLTNKQRAEGHTHFTIMNQTMTRTFGKTQWCGMEFNKVNNEFYPMGYDSISV
jgi:hypothetical protein